MGLVCSSCSEFFKLNHSMFFKWNKNGWIVYTFAAETLISVCQCVSTECDSLPVWPCGTPSLLQLEGAYERATHHQLPAHAIVCVCVCVGATVGILKFFPGEWQAYQRPESLPAKPVAHTHWQIYIYIQLKGIPKCAHSIILPKASYVIFMFYSTVSLNTLVCRQLACGSYCC